MKNSPIYFLLGINLIFLFSWTENRKVESVDDDILEGLTYPLAVKDEFGFSWPEGLVVDDIIYLQTEDDLLIVSFSNLMVSPSNDRFDLYIKKNNNGPAGRSIATTHLIVLIIT